MFALRRVRLGRAKQYFNPLVNFWLGRVRRQVVLGTKREPTAVKHAAPGFVS